MAIHIQMSEEAEQNLKKAQLRNKLSAVLSCLLFLGLGGLSLWAVKELIEEVLPPSFASYEEPRTEEPPNPNPVTSEEMASAESSASPEAASPMLVADSATAVSMPISAPSMDMGDGLSLEVGLGDGFGSGDLGDGFGNGGDGMGSTKGGGSTLVGTFYDLKKTSRGGASGLEGGFANQNKVIDALSKCFSFNSWNTNALNRYYKSDTKLYASNWYLPVAQAKYAPIAFQVGDPKKPESQWVCKPSAWVAIYRGTVKAPVTGKFRFIGTGDDFFAVRWEGKTVLDAGYRLPTLWDPKNPKACWISGGDGQLWRDNIKNGKDKQRKNYDFIKGIPGCNIWDNELGGLVAGNHFDVKEGKEYEIEIAISEIPGGKFGFILFIEELDEKGNPKDASKGKKYDLFRTTDSNPDVKKVMQALKDAGCYVQDATIPFNDDSYVWEVVGQ